MWTLCVTLLFEKISPWLLCFVALVLYYNYTRRKLYWCSWQLPGPVALPIVGNLWLYADGTPAKEILNVTRRVIANYDVDLFRIWFGPTLWLVAQDPGIIQQVNQKTPFKGPEYQYLMRGFGDRGNFPTNDIAHWRNSKHAYLSALSSTNLKSYVQIFHAESLRSRTAFQAYADSGQSVFPGGVMSMYTLACVVRCHFDYDIHTKDVKESQDMIQAMHECLEFFQYRMLVLPLRFDFVYNLTSFGAREAKHVKTIKAYLNSFVEYHAKNKKQTECNESLFIHKITDDKIQLSHHDLLAQMFTMFIGATDALNTTYIALMVLLAQNPDVQEKVYNEVVETLGDDLHNCPSVEDLNRMEYVERVVKETLRLFPPGPFIGRTVKEAFTVKDSKEKEHLLPAGATVVMPVHSIHYNKKYFANPTTFDPDRWLPKAVTKRHPDGFLSFSNGIRGCPGPRYTMLQFKTMLAMLVRTFELQATEKCSKLEDIRYQMSMVLSLEETSEIVLKKRDGGKQN